eukprot:TRINITY_DN23365_c0_g1_i1.p1 TRINITY_DN23365_c0_g1~~TRINITY_DN23365_c0_g1_i1.p1  ORF type:complete len:561 (-),score=106.83 TRINITY_DN23365_c0_g1_i1:132-1814(-)
MLMRCLAVALGITLADGAAPAAKPNVVIIFADDMGYGDTSHTGNPTALTPHLDRMAAEGMRFTQWYSGFHVCSPSRASMLTGRLPVRSGCAGSLWTGGVFTDDAVGGLPDNETTLAELLKPHGYTSMAIGKWHLGQQEHFLPLAQGFDEYFGIPFSVDMGRSAWMPDAKRVSVLPLIHNTSVIEQPVNLDTLDARYAEKAVSFIHAQAAAKTPFFLYFACNHVHVPDYASEGMCNSSKRGRYGDALAEMDRSIGAVLQGLRSAGVDENTIVFFTSDNGPWLKFGVDAGSAGPFFEGKGTTWEGGIREPAIVRWPGRIAPGSISTAVAATYDIFVTVAALAGAALPEDRVIDGQDLSGILLRGAPEPSRCLFHYKGRPSTGLPPAADDPKPGLWAVRCGAYKAHFVTQCAVMHRYGDKRCSSSLASGEDHIDADPGYWSRGSWPWPIFDSAPIVHDPPLLYNVEHDLSEQFPIPSTSAEYAKALALIQRARALHEATLTPVPDQMGRGGNPDLKVCCDAASKSKLPTYPNCTCNPENFDRVFVCAPVFPPTHVATSEVDFV